MSKRFIDTALWGKEWFTQLSPIEKAAVMYLLTVCDNVGVWSPNYRLAEFIIGGKIDWEELPEKMNGNVELLENGKWWFADFCEFQYGTLKPTCKPHQSYIRLLEKHGLLERLKGMDSVQEKDIDKDIDKDKEKEKEKRTYAPNVTLTEEEHDRLIKDFGGWTLKKMVDKLSTWKGANGKRYKSDNMALRGWVKEWAEKSGYIRKQDGPPKKTGPEYRCPECGVKLEKQSGANEYGCTMCRRFYELKDGKPVEVVYKDTS